jgi:hypothetical protein
MPRLEIPLIGRPLWTTGDILIRAELDLLLEDALGLWKVETFRVDPGTEMTTLPAVKAKSLSLPCPKQATPGLLLAGREVRSGVIRAQIVAMGGREHVFPCYFVGDPDATSTSGQPSAMLKNLLGLTGVVTQVTIFFDGAPTPAAPYGILVVEEK